MRVIESLCQESSWRDDIEIDSIVLALDTIKI